MSRLERKGGRTVTVPDAGDFEDAATEGVWYPQCPICGSLTPAEPDAEMVVCQTCDSKVDLDPIV